MDVGPRGRHGGGGMVPLARWSAPGRGRALKRGREASDDRVVDSLYRLAIGWNGKPPNLGACCFWLKNRRPSEWRDVQQLTGDIGHYIISDRPMTEQQWIEERTKLVEAKASPVVPETTGSEGTPSNPNGLDE